MTESVILSHWQAAPLLEAHQQGRHLATTSLDLGTSEVEAIIESEHVVLAPGIELSFDTIREIAQDQNACYLVESGKSRRIQRFSDRTNLFYSLLPTNLAPTLMVSGLPMHRIKDTNPWLDSQSKVRALGGTWGQLLDTCTGLGYTAILAAAKSASVITVELDPAVLELARLNPWSKELFNNPKIHQMVGSVVEEIEGFGDEMFSNVIHDPPTMNLAGDIYSRDFYRELYRVLGFKGRLFLYTGDPKSKLGRNTAKGVAQRLREVGFLAVEPRDEAFGLVAYKTA